MEQVKTIPGLYHKRNWLAFSAMVAVAAIGLEVTMASLDVDLTPDAPVMESSVKGKLQTLPGVESKNQSQALGASERFGILINGKVLGNGQEYIDVVVPPGQTGARLHVALHERASSGVTKSKDKLMVAADMPVGALSWGDGRYLYLNDLKPGQYKIAVRQLVITKNVAGSEQLFNQDIVGTLGTIGGCLKASNGCVLTLSKPQYMGPFKPVKQQLSELVQNPSVQGVSKVLVDERAKLLQTGKEALWTLAIGALLIRLGGLRVLPQLPLGKDKAPLRARALRI